jgi:hypothetical protein
MRARVHHAFDSPIYDGVISERDRMKLAVTLSAEEKDAGAERRRQRAYSKLLSEASPASSPR